MPRDRKWVRLRIGGTGLNACSAALRRCWTYYWAGLAAVSQVSRCPNNLYFPPYLSALILFPAIARIEKH